MNPFYGDMAGAFDAPTHSFNRMLRDAQAIRVTEEEAERARSMAPLEMRERQLRVSGLERKAQADAQLRELFAGGMPEGEGMSESRSLSAMAKRIAPLDPVLAGQFLTRASQAAGQEELAAQRAANAERSRAIAMARVQERLVDVLGVIDNPEQFERTRQGWLQSPEVLGSPFAQEFFENLTWERYRALPDVVKAEGEKAKQRDRERRTSIYGNFAEVAAARVGVQAAGEARRAAAGDARAKVTGPKPLTTPTETQKRNAQAYIRGLPEYAQLGGNELRALSADVASRTLRILRERPQVDATTAQAAALNEILEEGLLSEEAGMLGTKRWRYNSLSPQAASKLPSGAPAAAKQIGSQAEYNALPTGAKFIWNGKEYTKGAK